MSIKIATPAGVARYLVGRRIVAVDLRPFSDCVVGHERDTYDPYVTLDDGSVLRFVVRETETGEYGVDMIRDSVWI